MDIPQTFDDDQTEKIIYIQQQTNQEIAEILKEAIILYYQKLNPARKTALELFKESGLVGCMDADPDLSINYKSLMRKQMLEKYEQNQE